MRSKANVIPIVYPTIDWQSFVTNVNRILGRSPTRSLDAAYLEVGDPFSFIASLAEFQQPSSVPWEAVKNADRLLQALHFVFIVEADNLLASLVRENSNLNIITPIERDAAFIITANLYDLRNAIVEGSGEKKDFYLRDLMNKLYNLLVTSNLAAAFKRWNKQSNPDGTFSFT